MNPRNVGDISDADGVGVVGSEECGDMIKVWIKIASQHLEPPTHGFSVRHSAYNLLLNKGL